MSMPDQRPETTVSGALSGLMNPCRIAGCALPMACMKAAGQTEPLISVRTVSITPTRVQKMHILRIPT